MRPLAQFILALVGVHIAAAGIAHAQDRCRQRDPELTQQVRDLVSDVEAGRRPDLNSVDAFLAAVPETIRKSMIFIGDSRSLQESTRENPRILIKSPNSDVVMSFNTDPRHRGYDAVEMVLWDGATARLEMVEIRFSKDTEVARADPVMGPGEVEVTRNPQKCTVCHFSGGDMRWVFDPYRLWAGHIPWSEDALQKGSIEVEWYKEFLGRIASGEPRWRNLIPFETPEQIDAELERKGRVQIQSTDGETTQPNNTPSLDLSHQILIYNGCRIAWQLKDRPDWDKIKYAVTAAVTNRCDDPTEFLNDAGNEIAQKRLMDRGLATDDDGAFSFDELVKETRTSQWSLSPDREGRQLWFFEKYLGDLDAARAEIDRSAENLIRNDSSYREGAIRFPTFEEHQMEVAKSRYLLEPLGIDVTQWSMAVDPGTQSHVEFFDEIPRAQPIRDVLQEIYDDDSRGSFCEKLARKSREAMGDVPRVAPEFDLPDFCSKEDIVARVLALTDELEPVAVRTDAAEALTRCPACHSTRSFGAPRIPFDDMSALEQEIRKTRGTFGDLGERIWDRVSRHPEEHGAMPKFGSGLSTDEKTAIRAWLDSLGPES